MKSPAPGVYFTVETFYGHGPADADFTWVYANFEHNGASAKVLVLTGAYLEVSKIVWGAPLDATLCLKTGTTNSFRNEVVLEAGGASVTIHSHLQEHCE